MVHSKKELNKAGTERRIYDSFMREMKGYDLANYDKVENSESISLGIYFPGFLSEEIQSNVRTGHVEFIAKNREGKKIFFVYEFLNEIDLNGIIISHEDGLAEIIMPKKG
jgi:hypothetical protein